MLESGNYAPCFWVFGFSMDASQHRSAIQVRIAPQYHGFGFCVFLRFLAKTRQNQPPESWTLANVKRKINGLKLPFSGRSIAVIRRLILEASSMDFRLGILPSIRRIMVLDRQGSAGSSESKSTISPASSTAGLLSLSAILRCTTVLNCSSGS